MLAVEWDFLMWMSQREVAEVVQVARSHAPRCTAWFGAPDGKLIPSHKGFSECRWTHL